MQIELAHGQDASAPAGSPNRPLRVYGNRSTLELAPVLLALRHLRADQAVLQQGGITSLYGKAGDLPNMMVPGSCDLATNSETQALRFSVEHPGLRCILTVAEGVYRILARRGAGIATLADLRGKRIGTMPHTSSAYYLHCALRSAGVGDAEVTLVPYVAGTNRPLPMMTDALLAGELDAMTVWEPEMQRAEDVLGAELVELHDPAGYREHFALFTTDAKLRDETLRSAIVAFVAEVVRASESLRRDPREAMALVTEASGHDAGRVARAWRHHTFPGTLLPNMLDVMAQEEAWVAREQGRAPRPREALAPLIDDSVLREALQRLGRA